ncbi:hypothetical protein M011DRAFT_43879 [Sporormia fimetaria CBS 119925]|uniref:F-box domain-containing protein n=1 Tax=Sporormia fimetaria CBS 119925 TaxID=1340428 RepID=A0A6A6VC02_9PLEO|nr:hypothetical protein M011DRAFT_43879 [Sporormia fimetaria CBS 119925]
MLESLVTSLGSPNKFGKVNIKNEYFGPLVNGVRSLLLRSHQLIYITSLTLTKVSIAPSTMASFDVQEMVVLRICSCSGIENFLRPASGSMDSLILLELRDPRKAIAGSPTDVLAPFLETVTQLRGCLTETTEAWDFDINALSANSNLEELTVRFADRPLPGQQLVDLAAFAPRLRGIACTWDKSYAYFKSGCAITGFWTEMLRYSRALLRFPDLQTVTLYMKPVKLEIVRNTFIEENAMKRWEETARVVVKLLKELTKEGELEGAQHVSEILIVVR